MSVAGIRLMPCLLALAIFAHALPGGTVHCHPEPTSHGDEQPTECHDDEEA